MIFLNNYRLKIILSLVAILVFIAMFIYDPTGLVKGVSDALTLCATAVIPPLFPFMVLSDFIIRSGLCDIIGNFLAPITKFVLNLPGSAGCAVFMSAVGGYPVGAKMTAHLLEGEKITRSQGKRMMLFCVNAGPAFVIGTVGAVMFSSRRAGIILYLSMLISSLFIGVFLRFFDSEKLDLKRAEIVFDPSVASQSIMQGTNSILMMCGWILIFSCINVFIKKLPLNENTLVWLNMITEVTSGCSAASKMFPVSVQALVMGWAGLSVHCQLFPFVKATGLRLTHFFLSRLVHGGLATAVAVVLFRFFPCEVSVFSANADVLPAAFSVSAPAAAAMLILCAFLIIDNKAKTLT